MGLVGCGNFGSFVADSLADVPGTRLVAVVDRDPARADALASRVAGTTTTPDLDSLLADDDIDVIVIATSPRDHVELAVRSLEGGRHVLVEKPLALDLDGCRRVAEAARANDRVVAVDHMLRFAPLARLLGLEHGATPGCVPALGAVRRFSFENDATDEGLPPDHWFWDVSHSGGIHVEHGVHFFDLASWFIGVPARFVQAAALGANDAGRIDTVCSTATFGAQASATWYHSFSHPRRCERQSMRIDLGSTEIRLDGWIPLGLTIDTVTTEAAARSLGEVLRRLAAEFDVDVDMLDVEGDRCRAALSHRGVDAKAITYRRCIVDLVTDLVVSIDGGREPKAGVDVASAAVALAVAATSAAATGSITPVPGGAIAPTD